MSEGLNTREVLATASITKKDSLEMASVLNKIINMDKPNNLLDKGLISENEFNALFHAKTLLDGIISISERIESDDIFLGILKGY